MKVGKLKRWDAAEHLDTTEAQAEYLSMVLADGDIEEIRDALNVVARARGMAEIAKAADISREGLYRALGTTGNPEFGTVLRVMRALGIQLQARPAAGKKSAPRRKAKTAA